MFLCFRWRWHQYLISGYPCRNCDEYQWYLVRTGLFYNRSYWRRLISLDTGFFFDSSSRSCTTLLWIFLLVAFYSGKCAAPVDSTKIKLGLTLSISMNFFALGYTEDFGLGVLVNIQHVPFAKFWCGCVSIWLRQNSAAKWPTQILLPKTIMIPIPLQFFARMHQSAHRPKLGISVFYWCYVSVYRIKP